MTDFEYESLVGILDFTEFSFRDYLKHEQTILKPQLKKLGFKDISFVDGEADNFGPLSRICRCTDKRGKPRHFYYG